MSMRASELPMYIHTYTHSHVMNFVKYNLKRTSENITTKETMSNIKLLISEIRNTLSINS